MCVSTAREWSGSKSGSGSGAGRYSDGMLDFYGFFLYALPAIMHALSFPSAITSLRPRCPHSRHPLLLRGLLHFTLSCRHAVSSATRSHEPADRPASTVPSPKSRSRSRSRSRMSDERAKLSVPRRTHRGAAFSKPCFAAQIQPKRKTTTLRRTRRLDGQAPVVKHMATHLQRQGRAVLLVEVVQRRRALRV